MSIRDSFCPGCPHGIVERLVCEVMDLSLIHISSHVAPGGILAYATCTVTHEENADAVEAFLATEAGAAFEVVPCRNPDLDIELPFFSTVLEPGGPDAHFLALLRRKA